MNSFAQVEQWIAEDDFRIKCLRTAQQQISLEWYLSAGFVRNLIWDKLHGYEQMTPLNDIDLIYFDSVSTSISVSSAGLVKEEKQIEQALKAIMPACNWSVKNQARMGLKHGHAPYSGCIEAMSYWPEIQTAIGATLHSDGQIVVRSPFSAEKVVNLSASRNPKCTSDVFPSRVAEKRWSVLWPNLDIED